MTSDPVTDSAVVCQKPHLDCFVYLIVVLDWHGGDACFSIFVSCFLDLGFAASDRLLLFFRGDMSAFISCGGLFSTLIFLKNFAIFCRFVFVDFENTYFSVITWAAYKLFRSLLKAGQSQSIWWAVSIG